MSGSLETNGGTQLTSYGDLHPIPPPSAQWRLKNVFSNGASIAAVRTDETRRVAASDGRVASQIRTGPITCAKQVIDGRSRLSPCNFLREQALP
jgi:hypothetical protein